MRLTVTVTKPAIIQHYCEGLYDCLRSTLCVRLAVHLHLMMLSGLGLFDLPIAYDILRPLVTYVILVSENPVQDLLEDSQCS